MKKWCNLFYDKKDLVKSLELTEEDIKLLFSAYEEEKKRVRLSTCVLDISDVYLITEVEMEEPEEENEETVLRIDLRSYPDEVRNQIRAMWTQDPSMNYGGDDIG